MVHRLYPAWNNLYAMLTATISIMTLTLLLIRRFIIPVAIPIAGSILAAIFSEIAGYFTNAKIMLLFIVAGAVYELTVIILRSIISDKPEIVILGGTISSGSIPWFMALMISQDISKDIIGMANATLFFMLLGLASSLAAYIIWYAIRSNKTIIRIRNKY